MRRILLSLPLLLLTILFALPALAGNWGENWGSMIWGSVAAVPSLEGVGVWLLVISLLGAAAWRLRRRSTHAGLMLVLLPLLPLLMAPHYTNWNAFSNGEVADAGEVNANFVDAAAALDDFEARVSALEAAAQIYEKTAFKNFVENETVTLTALCDGGDIALGGAARGEAIAISSEGRYAQPPGTLSIGPQGWTATATSGAGGGAQFMLVHAVCVKF